MAEENLKKSQIYDEFGSLSEEFSFVKEGADTGHEYVPPKEKEHINKKSKSGKKFIQRHGVKIMQTAAVCLAVIMVKDAFGYDLLAEDPFNDAFDNHHMDIAYPEPPEDNTDIPVQEPIEEKVSDVSSIEPDIDEEKAPIDGPDDAFPALTNLEPNGYVPGFGVLDEQYVMVEYSAKEPDYIYRSVRQFLIDDNGLHLENGEVISDYYYMPDAVLEDMYDFNQGDKYPAMTWFEGAGLVAYRNTQDLADGSVPQPLMTAKIVNESIPGAYYNEATNTLTLDNYSGEYLNINLMGNGFKLRLVGENKLKGIVAWGFMYGGSLTITGDGYLAIENNTNPCIRLECEGSPSCLMIDSGVTIETNGGAIEVRDSTLEKGIYYLKPLEVTGSDDKQLMRYFQNINNHNIWGFRFEDGSSSTIIKISPKED